MNRQQFIDGYVMSFLGAWAAKEYDGENSTWQKRIIDPPIEDAIFQAEETWKRFSKSDLCDTTDDNEEIPF